MRALLAAALATTALAAHAQPAPPVGRLSGEAVPTAYRLALTVDPAAPTFTGRTEIDLQLKAATSRIYLHGRDLTVTRAVANTGRMAPNPGTYKQLLPTGVSEIVFARPLQPGRHTLIVDYSASFQQGTQGLYRVKVGDSWYAYTQFESIDARRAFPGFDEPGFKTPYTLTITAPVGQTVLANTPATGTAPAPGGMTRHSFAASKPLPTYLVALGVGPFETVAATAPANGRIRPAPLPMRVIAEKGQTPRLGAAARAAPALLALLETYFDRPYPYEKLDSLASPVMGGAMENAGLITYDDTLLLIDPDAPPSQVLSQGSVIAHEQAHQWFGDLVTPAWWDDIWLNESFATWAAAKVAAQWNPAAGVEANQLAGSLGAMTLDAQARGRPIRQTIARNEEIDSAFDGITYQKGAQVLKMIEAYAGETAFRRGVQLHMKRYAYGNATGDQFFQSIADGSGKPEIIPAFRSFIEQQGVPVVTVAEGQGGVTLTQARYTPIGVTAPARAPVWQIPVCLKMTGGAPCVLTGATPASARGMGELLIPNAGARGYYRFDYAQPSGWDRAVAAAPRLTGTEQMALADSLWASFIAGRASFTQVLAGTTALAPADERYAATALPDQMRDLIGRVGDPKLDAAYGRFVGTTYRARLDAIGFDPRPGVYAAEAPARRELRRNLAGAMALDARDPAIRARLAPLGRAYAGGDKTGLDPAFRQQALSVAVRDGDAAFADRLFEAAASSTDAQFRRQAFAALGNVDRADLAPAILARSSDKRLRGRDSLFLIGGMVGNASTRDIGYDYAVANFDQIYRSASLIASFALGIGGQYCSTERAERVERDFRPFVAKYTLSPLELDRAIERIRQCAALAAAQGPGIRAGLGVR